MKRGDVWWVSFDPTVGTEIRKTRPAVIVSNDRANAFLRRFQVVPITSNVTRLYASEALVSVIGRPGKALADQIRTVDRKRLGGFLCQLTAAEMMMVEAALRLQLHLN